MDSSHETMMSEIDNGEMSVVFAGAAFDVECNSRGGADDRNAAARDSVASRWAE